MTLLLLISRTKSCKTLPRLSRIFSSIPDRGPTVSILGPPNAGKSTLFNQLMCKTSNKSYRLSTEKKYMPSNGRIGFDRRKSRGAVRGGAIISPVAGTTRDRRECIGRIGGTYFTLFDTAGVDGYRIKSKKDSMESAMMQQTLVAARDSDVIILIFDARIGVTSDVSLVAKWLRSNQCEGKVILLGNKLEGDSWSGNPDSVEMEALAEAGRLGLGEAIPFSAIHKEGFADVAVKIEEAIDELGLRRDDEESVALTRGKPPLQLAILGRPNVGKSTLVNALLGVERCIVGPNPGVTRDAITSPLKYKSHFVKIVDTAGIRKMSKRDHDDTIEDQSVRDAMRAMKTADVAALVLDAGERVILNQELAIMNAVVKEGRSLVVVGNKMDLIVDEEYTKEDFREAVQEQIEIRFPMLRKTPVVVMSSLHNQNVKALLPKVINARDRWERIIPTGLLNRWLKEVNDTQRPTSYKGKVIKVKYIMQTKGRPPTFLLFCNHDEVPDHYISFLRRHFQDSFQMFGMEVRMAIKKSAAENPFDPHKKRGGSGLGGHKARKERLLSDLRTFGEKRKRRRSMKQKYNRRK